MYPIIFVMLKGNEAWTFRGKKNTDVYFYIKYEGWLGMKMDIGNMHIKKKKEITEIHKI